MKAEDSDVGLIVFALCLIGYGVGGFVGLGVVAGLSIGGMYAYLRWYR